MIITPEAWGIFFFALTYASLFTGKSKNSAK